jgi:hypothetical protein
MKVKKVSSFFAPFYRNGGMMITPAGMMMMMTDHGTGMM